MEWLYWFSFVHGAGIAALIGLPIAALVLLVAKTRNKA